MTPRASLVESLPLGLENLATPGSTLTADALVNLLSGAVASVDVTAMYWSLRPLPDAPDTDAWTSEELKELFGAAQGGRVFDALSAAAGRGVRLRILQAPGAGPPDRPSESELLATEYPDLVEIREVDLAAWFGQGIMHQKLVVVDGRAAYVGSANMDWRSLTQVKELGVVLEDEVQIVGDLLGYFEDWWHFAASPPPDRPVDANAPGSNRPGSRPASSWGRPLKVTLDGIQGDAVVSGSPQRLCVRPRTEDSALLTATIRDATVFVDINVMDFAPISIYSLGEPGEHAHPAWWPDLTDALLHVVLSRGVSARLLVSKWSHTSPYVAPFLDALQELYRAGSVRRAAPTGTLEIRRFVVPGWDQTSSDPAARGSYPDHTRVNHTKYIVTDRRINVGTSNMTWDYFHGTAGLSVNLSHDHLVRQLREAFDRDWNSGYAIPLAVD